jgi:hypothetical protein
MEGPPTLSGPVRQVEVPADARALSTLSRIDYQDAFLVDVPAPERTAEQWARAILEDAPMTTRRALQSGWSAIGLKLGGARPGRSVLGWELRRSNADFVLLAAESRIGMPGQLLFQRRQDTLLFATFVQQDNPLARATWAGVEPVHVPIVRRILEQAQRRA